MNAEPGPPFPSSAAAAAEALPATLRTFDLRRSFGKVHAVRGLDIVAPEGQIYGFLGRNGAGKTTTIRMLMGIIKPDRGKIEILGKRTRRTTLAQKRHIGYVSQDQHFYPWMNCESLGRFVSGFYPTWDKDEFRRLLGVLDLPPGRRFSQLSGGMRVKLALALALAHRPTLLILDEPTSGLDPVARREFLEIIQYQARNYGRTTFFSTHRIDEVERAADRVGIIHEGVMRFEGDLSLLKASVKRVTLRRRPPPAETRKSEAEPAAFPWISGDTEPGGPPEAPGATPPPFPVTTLSHPYTPENGFELLREETMGEKRVLVLKADPFLWNAPPFDGATIEPLSLEDVFLAYAEADIRGI